MSLLRDIGESLREYVVAVRAERRVPVIFVQPTRDFHLPWCAYSNRNRELVFRRTTQSAAIEAAAAALGLTPDKCRVIDTKTIG